MPAADVFRVVSLSIIKTFSGRIKLIMFLKCLGLQMIP